MNGKLIVVEGNDSSGKETQTDLLINRLRKKYKVEKTDFPQYYDSFYGDMIARYLRGEFGPVNQISPYLSSLLYALDRMEAKDKIINLLNQGKIIISNRYVPSNKAYGAAKLEKKDQKKFIKWIEKLEYEKHKIPKPDLVIYLHVPVQITQQWIETKKRRDYLEGNKKDLHEKNVDYLQKVEKIYLELCREKNWVKIPCVLNQKVLSEEKIAQKVYKKVIKKLEL